MANAADVRAEAETLRQMLTQCRAPAVRCRVQSREDATRPSMHYM